VKKNRSGRRGPIRRRVKAQLRGEHNLAEKKPGNNNEAEEEEGNSEIAEEKIGKKTT